LIILMLFEEANAVHQYSLIIASALLPPTRPIAPETGGVVLRIFALDSHPEGRKAKRLFCIARTCTKAKC